jgi:hypothetical protein
MTKIVAAPQEVFLWKKQAVLINLSANACMARQGCAAPILDRPAFRRQSSRDWGRGLLHALAKGV